MTLLRISVNHKVNLACAILCLYHVQGWIVTVVEVLAISTLVFLVLTELSPGIGILVVSGIFITQIFVNVLESDFVSHIFSCSHKSRFMPRPAGKQSPVNCMSCCSASIKLLAFLLQATGLATMVGYWIYTSVAHGSELQYRLVVGLPVSIVALSIAWNRRVQSFISMSSENGVSARYKSSKMCA